METKKEYRFTTQQEIDSIISGKTLATIKNTYGKRFYGVYFLINGDEIVYVGQSTGVLQRVRSHIRMNEKTFDHFFAVECHDMMRVESGFIFDLMPMYNKCLSPKHIGLVTDYGLSTALEMLGLEVPQKITTDVVSFGKEFYSRKRVFECLFDLSFEANIRGDYEI